MVSKTIIVEPFLQLHLCTQCNVEIVSSDEEKVIIEMDDNLIEGVRVDNSIKTLFVTQDVRQKVPLFTQGKITVFCKSLEALYITSHADIRTANPIVSQSSVIVKTVTHGDVLLELKAPSVKVMTTNHGDFVLKCFAENLVVNSASKGDLNMEFHGDSAEINHKGRGDVSLSGQCLDLTLSNEGHGDIDGTAFSAQTANIKSTGHGDTLVSVLRSLRIQNLGHGDVIYSGSGELQELTHSGHGKVLHRE